MFLEDDSDSRSSSNLPKFERDVLFGDSEAVSSSTIAKYSFLIIDLFNLNTL